MQPRQHTEVSVDAYPDLPPIGKVESFTPGSGAELTLLLPDNQPASAR
jgi:hypothetical protein